MIKTALPLLLLGLGAGCATPAPPAPRGLETLWLDGDFTEGPALAPDGSIWFTDIGNRILRFDPKGGATSVAREPSGKANGLDFDRQGRLVACEGAAGGNRRVSVTERSGEVRTLADRWEGKRFNSPNDLAFAPDGAVYFTDPRYGGDEPRELDFEGVFRVGVDGKVSLATREVEKPNGILVSPDGRTVYVADNNPKGVRRLLAFGVRADGALEGKRVLHDFGAGSRGIDGMAFDARGRIFATAGTGNAAGVYVFEASGRLVEVIRMPGDPTNCVFGPEGALYVTCQGPAVEGKPRRYGLFRLIPTP
jgi:gluconolactonase